MSSSNYFAPYLLTVIIPTKNRHQYVQPCLDAIVSFGSDEIEVVVQDNSDDSRPLRDFVAGLRSQHVKLFHTEGPLSQTENSELAVTHATGEFVCYIGDDDCILPEMLDVVKQLPVDVDAVTFPGAVYFWPDIVFKRIVYPNLSFPSSSGRLTDVDSRSAVEACLAIGASRPKGLAGVYHGLVRRSLLERVRDTCGSYFPGPSPDMANAISVSVLARRVVNVDAPLYIDGFGYHSAGGRGVRGEHNAPLSEISQIPSDTEAKWCPMIPRIWLGPTIWADSAVKALEALGRPDLVAKIRWSKLYAQILVDHPDCARYVTPLLKSPRTAVATVAACLHVFVRKALAFARNLLYARAGMTSRIVSRDNHTVISAVREVSKHVGPISTG